MFWIGVVWALLSFALETGVSRVVYASSSSVYGDSEDFPLKEGSLPKPVSPYGVTKLAGEHLCPEPIALVATLFAAGSIAGALLAFQPINGRTALRITTLPPLGALLGFVFC